MGSSSSNISSGFDGDYFNQPGLSRFLESGDVGLLRSLFTSYVTRLELLGKNLDMFLPKICRSTYLTMAELRELAIDGQNTTFGQRNLELFQDIIRRGDEFTGTLIIEASD
jgi:hypothetical protein